MSQTVWIGIDTESLEPPVGSAAVNKEELDRGTVIPVSRWNAGIEAVTHDGVIIGYGIIVNEDFPNESELDRLMTYQGYVAAVTRVLDAHGLKGPVMVIVCETDPSRVPELGMGEPNIPSKSPETVH